MYGLSCMMYVHVMLLALWHDVKTGEICVCSNHCQSNDGAG